MFLHVHPVAPKADTFSLQAETLLQAGFPLQPDMASCPHHAVPGQTSGNGRMQCPDHLACRAGMARHPRHPTIGAHAPARNPAYCGQQSLEHLHYRDITRPSPAIPRAMPGVSRVPRWCGQNKGTTLERRPRRDERLGLGYSRLAECLDGFFLALVNVKHGEQFGHLQQVSHTLRQVG